jgi:hypothetical protein
LDDIKNAQSGPKDETRKRRHYFTTRECQASTNQRVVMSNPKLPKLAAPNDVRHILGDLDESKILSILALRPTVAHLEEAVTWLSGDRDVFEPRPLKDIASQIVSILTENEEEEPRHSP